MPPHAFVQVPERKKKKIWESSCCRCSYSFIPAHASIPLYTLTQLLARMRQSLGNQKESVWVSACVCEYLCVLGGAIECLPTGTKQTLGVESVWSVLG